MSTNENGKSFLVIFDLENGKSVGEFEIPMKIDQMVWSSSKNAVLVKSKDSDETFSVDKQGKTTKVLDCLYLAKND